MTSEKKPLPPWITDRGHGYYTIDIEAAQVAGETLPIQLDRTPQFAEFFTDPPTRSGTIDFLSNNQHLKLFYNP